MNQGHFATEMVRSFTSVRFYQELVHRRLLDGVKYFSTLILLVAFLLSVRFTFEIFKGLAHFEEWAGVHLPEIVIEGGKVAVDAPQPWQRQEGNFVMIMDTTGKTTEIDETSTQGFLLTQDRLILKRNPYETRRYDLSRVDSFRLNAAAVRKWGRIGRWLLPPLLSVFLFVYFWIGKFSQVLFFSFISVLTNWITHRDLSYGTLLTIGMYAMTPPLLLLCVVALLGIQVRFFDMIYLSSYAALLVAAILQCQPKDDTIG